MYGDLGSTIGMKKKEKMYKEIIRKLLAGEGLSDEPEAFLENIGLGKNSSFNILGKNGISTFIIHI